MFLELIMADRTYTARLVTNPGRPGFLVEYRHPGIPDRHGYGRKVTRGLKTRDVNDAEKILSDLNKILADKSLHELGARKIAAARLHTKAVEVFYEVYSREDEGTRRREKLIPLEASDRTAPVVALVGNTSVGKTTLLRHLIGTDPVSERFPATSGNRTTLFPFEVVVEDGKFRAAVSFRSETETEQALQQMVLRAVMKALNQASDEVIIRELFEPTEDGLRLKYLLGVPRLGGQDQLDLLAQQWVLDIKKIAEFAASQVTSVFQDGLDPSQENASVLRELIEDEAEESDILSDFVTMLVEELRDRSEVDVPGNISRTATGWPTAWKFEASASEREKFIKEIKRFTGNAREEFGKLLTPLVNGVRVAGPFFASTGGRRPLVLCDTVGFGHYADTASDLHEEYTALCDRADCILVVESAKTAFSSNSLHQVLEAAATTGHVKKLAVAFTHMDSLAGDDVIDDDESQEKALLGLRSAVDEHVAKKLSRESARQLMNHLTENLFFFSYLNVPNDTRSKEELIRISKHFSTVKPQVPSDAPFPEYDFKFFVPFVIAAIENFRTRWSALLGVQSHSVIDPLSWQAVKAVARRNAQNLNDNYPHRPVTALHAVLRQELAKFLDEPLGWPGHAPSEEEKQSVINLIKAELARPLLRLCARTLRTVPQTQWITAWEFRGPNSTIRRRSSIETLFSQHLPYFRLDNAIALAFINDVEALVKEAISDAKDKLRGSKKEDKTDHDQAA
jgi:hypothetical protein